MSQSIYPAIRYADADRAIEWLGEAFGAEPKEVHRDEQGVVHHAELRIEGSLMMLGSLLRGGFLGGAEPDPLRSTLSLYVAVTDPDAHHARARAAGATITRELQDTGYGSREYSARDLEGNAWSFGTYAPAA